jgi:glucose dehydrogenase
MKRAASSLVLAAFLLVVVGGVAVAVVIGMMKSSRTVTVFSETTTSSATTSTSSATTTTTSGGQLVWKFRADGAVTAVPAIADGVVCFGTDAGYLYAVDTKSGRERWRIKPGKSVSDPAISSGWVYFGSNDNHLYAVDLESGWQKWKFAARGSFYSRPAFFKMRWLPMRWPTSAVSMTVCTRWIPGEESSTGSCRRVAPYTLPQSPPTG